MLHICPGCGIPKPRDADHFNRRSASKDGLQPICKPCDSAKSTARNKGRLSAGLPRVVDPVRRAEALETDRVRALAKYHADPAAVLAREKRFRSTPEGRASRARTNRAWHEANPGYRRAARFIRESLIAQSGEHFTESDYVHLVVTQLGLCEYCKREMTGSGPLKMTVDHRVPVSRGGDNSALNIVLACSQCNCSKKDQTYEEFVLRRSTA